MFVLENGLLTMSSRVKLHLSFNNLFTIFIKRGNLKLKYLCSNFRKKLIFATKQKMSEFKKRLANALSFARFIFHWGYIPFVIYLGIFI